MDNKLMEMFDNISPGELEAAGCGCSGKISKRQALSIEKAALEKLGLVQRKRRSLRRPLLIVALAAAVCVGGALGAYASGKNGLWNGVKSYFGGGDNTSLTEAQQAVLENNTIQPVRVTENSFKDIEITYEGTLVIGSTGYSVFTLERTDGGSFEDDGEHEWIAEYSFSTSQINGFQPRRVSGDWEAVCSDGRLTVTIEASDYSNWLGDHSLLFGFKGLYRVPVYDDRYEAVISRRDSLCRRSYDVYWESALAEYKNVTDIYPEWKGDPYTDDEAFAEEFEMQEKELIEELKSLSGGEYFEGELCCEIDTHDMIEIAPAEAEGSGIKAEASVSEVRLCVPEEIYNKYYSTPLDNEERSAPDMILHFRDGSEETLSCRQYETQGDGRHYLVYLAGAPINTQELEYIIFAETKIEF